MKSLNDIVKNFNTTPFLFIGSGFSRRYYNLPDWKQLLNGFITRLDQDEFAFNRYESAAKNLTDHKGANNILSTVASLVQRDFDNRWYKDASFRMAKGKYLDFIRQGASPFKVEVAQYIDNNSSVVEAMAVELQQFHELSKRNIAGIITTNYDCLLEQHTDGYTTFTGQEELVFSALQGWAEIYKIHGSITDPASIVITGEDYQNFDEYSPYLAAKLMTIFMEYPIIFMGYSISDQNVRNILKQLAKCLSAENLKKLHNRFVYIEYKKNCIDIEFFEHTMLVENGEIYITGVRTGDFSKVYDVLANKRATIPTKLIRMFKKEFYDFALTNKPTSRIHVADIDDDRISDNDLAIAIGKPSRFAVRGLSGISTKEWYQHIVLHDLEFSADEILTYAFPKLDRSNIVLPLHRLISEAKQKYQKCEDKKYKNFDSILSTQHKKSRESRDIKNRSVAGIIKDFEGNYNKILYEIPFLSENEINVEDLENFLKQIFSSDGVYDNLDDNAKSYAHRLVRIYDYLRFGR